MSESEPIKCPGCSAPLPLAVVESVKDRVRFTMALEPKPGELMRAETIGGTLTNLSKLFRAVAKDREAKRTLLVEKIETTETGRIEIHFIECVVIKKDDQ